MVKHEIKQYSYREATITVDLDSFDLATEQGFGSGVPVVTLDILRGGKRVTITLDLFKHELKRDPTLRITTVNKSRDVTRTVQIRPWVDDK